MLADVRCHAWLHFLDAGDSHRAVQGLQIAAGDGPEELVLRHLFVLAMIGYSPDMTFLNATGITLDPDSQKPRTNPDTLESERKGIYLAGVIVAGMHTNEIFIENGRFHGAQIAEAIARDLV